MGGDRYLVVHGDRFDVTMNLTWVGDAADVVYRGVQRVSRPAAHFLKAASKHVCGVVGAVQRGALAHARERGFAGIITGHTHFHHDEHIDGLHYLNTGCWVDQPCSYVQVEGGVARLRHWLPGGAAAPVRKGRGARRRRIGRLPSVRQQGLSGRSPSLIERRSFRRGAWVLRPAALDHRLIAAGSSSRTCKPGWSSTTRSCRSGA